MTVETRPVEGLIGPLDHIFDGGGTLRSHETADVIHDRGLRRFLTKDEANNGNDDEERHQ